jgi:hypothetical protein
VLWSIGSSHSKKGLGKQIPKIPFCNNIWIPCPFPVSSGIYTPPAYPIISQVDPIDVTEISEGNLSQFGSSHASDVLQYFNDSDGVGDGNAKINLEDSILAQKILKIPNFRIQK